MLKLLFVALITLSNSFAHAADDFRKSPNETFRAYRIRIATSLSKTAPFAHGKTYTSDNFMEIFSDFEDRNDQYQMALEAYANETNYYPTRVTDEMIDTAWKDLAVDAYAIAFPNKTLSFETIQALHSGITDELMEDFPDPVLSEGECVLLLEEFKKTNSLIQRFYFLKFLDTKTSGKSLALGHLLVGLMSTERDGNFRAQTAVTLSKLQLVSLQDFRNILDLYNPYTSLGMDSLFQGAMISIYIKSKTLPRAYRAEYKAFISRLWMAGQFSTIVDILIFNQHLRAQTKNPVLKFCNWAYTNMRIFAAPF